MLGPDALARISLFQGIDREAIASLWALGAARQFAAGEEIFGRGSEARELLIVESGRVEVFFPLPILGATKDVSVQHLGPGNTLGWSALIRPFTLTLSARGVESCCLRALPREALQEYFNEHPATGFVFMENLAGVVGHRLDNFQDLWMREVQARIVGLLG